MNLKSLRSLVQTCKGYLEEDLSRQLVGTWKDRDQQMQRRRDPETWNHAKGLILPLAPEDSCRAVDPAVKTYVKELALSFFLQQVISHVWEQISLSPGSCISTVLPSSITPSESTLKKVQTCLREGISSADWHLPDILGWIYQFFMEETEEQIQKGQFYTYPWIGSYLVEKTLKTFWEEIKAGQRDLKRVKEIKLLDPACGCGSLLIQAFEVFYQMYQEEGEISEGEIPRYILKYNLYGIDIDPLACQLATLNLYLKAKEKDPGFSMETLPILCADTLLGEESRRGRIPEIAYQIGSYIHQLCQDFSFSTLCFSPPPLLAGEPSRGRGEGGLLPQIRGNGLQTTDSDPHAFFRQRYECIVGNPPYVVINQLKTPPEVVARYKRYRSATFKINTFALFLERGIELLAPKGLLSYVVPNTLFTQVYFEALRKYLLEKTRILEIMDTKGLFQNAFVENCIISLERESQEEQRKNQEVQIKVPPAENLRILQGPGNPVFSCYQTHTIRQSQFYRTPGALFNIYLKGAEIQLMDKIEAGCWALGEICESHDGINPGNVKRKLISTRKLTEHHKKVLNGKDIWRYGLRWSGLYIWYDRRILEPGDNMRWGSERALKSAKILTRQTADRIIGTFDEGIYYVTNTIHTTILREGVQGVDLKYILALLNSKLLSFYYRKLIPETGQLFSQVKLVHLRKLPIKKVELQVQKEFVTLVDALMSAHQVPINQRSREEIHQIDLLLDRKVYELYELEESEIQRIEAAGKISHSEGQ
ncbi:MAG TPA: TaqI-like C-terminal specificity domain-containing protein [Candidatus Limnocylindrales bacterium]|nr:TaqI-like C-terminal specificity domain-containing protein [Candidatus Limnocylindrales bacterium]